MDSIRFKALALFLVFCSVLISSANAEDFAHPNKTFSLEPSQLEHRLGPYVEYLEDPESRLTIGDVLQKNSREWAENTDITPNFGYTNSAYWFKLSLHNATQENDLSRLLVIDYALLDRIEFFRIRDGELVDQYLTGDKFPFSQRPVAHRNFIFPLEFSADELSVVYFRIKSGGAIQVPLSIWEPQQFFLDDQAELVRKSLFYGVLSVMVLFNFFLFFSLKEAPYFYYVMFVFSFLLTQAAMHGVTYQYLWPDFPAVQEMAVLLGVPGCVLFTSLFSRSFLSLASHAPRMDLFFKVTATLGALNIIAAFILPYRLVTTSAVFMVAVVSLGCIFIGPYLCKKGHKIARFFTIAWMCMVVSTTLLALNKFGVIPYNFFTENGLQFGSALEAVLLSFALADRLNRERQDRWKAQQKMLSEVRQRHNIEETMIYDATHNHLTGLPNRAFMENRFGELAKHDLYKKEGIALVLLHFDRFHEISKTLGHFRADQLLKTVCLKVNHEVQALNGLIELEQDKQQSLGVALVEGVSVAMLIDRRDNFNIVQTAKALVELLSTPIEYDGLAIDVGASVGIAHYPPHGDDIDTLLSNGMIAVDVGIHGGDRVTEYSEEINPYNARRLTLMGDLRNAVNNDLLELDAEKELATAIAEQATKVNPLFAAGNYTEALQSLASLRPSIDRFFDDVMVMADDPSIRRNRLNLLGVLRNQAFVLARFDNIQS